MAYDFDFSGSDVSGLGSLGGLLTPPTNGAESILGGLFGSNTPKESEDDPECQNKGITDEGIQNTSRWKSILSAAIIIYNTLMALKIAKLQRDLAEKYIQLSEDHRNYYNDHFKPLEESMTKEAMDLPFYERNKDHLYTGQMLVLAKNRTRGAIDKSISCTGRYCTGQRNAIMTDQLLDQVANESLVAGMAHRYADREEITHNNLRWDKREQVLKIGRDIPTETASYANMAMGVLGDLTTQAGNATWISSERMETKYPPRRGDIKLPSYNMKIPQVEVPKYDKPVYETPKEPPKQAELNG